MEVLFLASDIVLYDVYRVQVLHVDVDKDDREDLEDRVDKVVGKSLQNLRGVRDD